MVLCGGFAEGYLWLGCSTSICDGSPGGRSSWETETSSSFNFWFHRRHLQSTSKWRRHYSKTFGQFSIIKKLRSYLWLFSSFWVEIGIFSLRNSSLWAGGWFTMCRIIGLRSLSPVSFHSRWEALMLHAKGCKETYPTDSLTSRSWSDFYAANRNFFIVNNFSGSLLWVFVKMSFDCLLAGGEENLRFLS